MSGYSQFKHIPPLLLLLFAQVAASSLLAQTSALQTKPPSASERQVVISSLEPSQQAILNTAAQKTAPVFIFIPGILGSRLSRISTGKDVPFWGTISLKDLVKDNPAFKYTEGEVVEAKVLDKLYAPLGRNIDVYGKAYSELKLITGSPNNVLRFAYDWRQSNVLSALNFSSWLCSENVQSVVKDRPIVFLAHSMGGLILKYWLEHSYNNDHCAGDTAVFASWMPILKIVFAGTPNFGAPKAVLSFSQGQSIYVDPDNDSPIWQALMAVDIKTLSRNLNTYGIRYPSAYQLLPIVNTTKACFNNPGWQTDLEFRTYNDVKANIDLFDPAAWKELGWPVQLSGQERDDFVEKELPSLLNQAKKFLCDVAEFDVDRIFEGRVVHFSGFDQKTVCKIIFRPPDFRGDFVDGKCDGDGTVPNWISADAYRVKAGQPTNRESHAKQMGAKEFSIYLQQLHNEIYASLAVKASELDGGAQAAAKMFAQLRYVPPSFPSTRKEDSVAIRKVADLVVKELGLSPKDDILRLAADKSQNPNDRVNLMLVFANLSDSTQRQRAWALNNAAHIDLASQNFSQSFELSKRALDYADAVLAANPKLGDEMRDLKSKAALTAAIASAHIGNKSAAKQLQEVAIENGSKKAINLSLPLSIETARGVSSFR